MTEKTHWNAATIRRQYFDFFVAKGHRLVASAPIVLKDDPSLMFTNAGMNQFKEAFLGNRPPLSPRVVDSQKCLRVSGKHNDLEEVGHDTYHHTMFEMLGNWSFGDYFKEEAIAWAWELLTQVYGLSPKRLYVTIFEGDSADALDRDEVAAEAWRQWVAPERILNGNKKDNFWEMGATGPCGPCSEIHVDLRSDAERQKISGAELVNRDHPQVVEIWNLVFMQYNRQSDGSLQKLPAQHVDTGMGFERLCMALQEKESTYDTDVFQPLIKKVSAITGKPYGQNEPQDIALRVIADHVRAVAFAIADGQLPSNNGAGYVIRRILRRAIRYGFSYLDFKEPFIYRLVTVLANQMGPFFPEISDAQDLVTKVIQEEETSFLRTLEQGLSRLDQILGESPQGKVPGAKVFELYDTYGFPPDLTALILREKGFSYSEEDYQSEMSAQKSRARAAAQVDTGDWVVLRDDVPQEGFVGYDTEESEVLLMRYRKVKRQKKEQVQLVFNRTPFYPEGGGQVGDSGFVQSGKQRIRITDTQKEHGLIIHFAEQLPEALDQRLSAVVDRERRHRTSLHHSATHLLHQALREVLGTHVEQKGSLVHPDYLRFDFSHFSKVSPEQLEQLEDLINARVRANFPLQEFRSIPFEEARAMGAMALFGEKYEEQVRVIQFGESLELCGGIHAGATGEIGLFAIKSEGAVAAGVRRIEALSGAAALQYFRTKTKLLEQVSAELKSPQNLLQGVQKLREESNRLRKEVEAYQAAAAQQEQQRWLGLIEERDGYRLLRTETSLEAKPLREAMHQLQKREPRLVAAVGTRSGAKPQIAVAVGQELQDTKKWQAGKLIKSLAAEIKGGGGGQAAFAMAGGSEPEGLPRALAKLEELLNSNQS